MRKLKSDAEKSGKVEKDMDNFSHRVQKWWAKGGEMERLLRKKQEEAEQRRLPHYLELANRLAEDAKLPILVQPRIVPCFLQPTSGETPSLWRYFTDGQMVLRVDFELFTKEDASSIGAKLPKTLWSHDIDGFIDLMDGSASGELATGGGTPGGDDRIWQPVPSLPLGQAFLYLAQLAHQSVAESEVLPILDVQGEHVGELHVAVQLHGPPSTMTVGAMTARSWCDGSEPIAQPDDPTNGLLNKGFRFKLAVQGLRLRPASGSPSSVEVTHAFDLTENARSASASTTNRVQLTRRSSEECGEGTRYEPADNTSPVVFTHVVYPRELTPPRLAYLLREAITFHVKASGDGFRFRELPRGNQYDLDHRQIDQETGCSGISRARHEFVVLAGAHANACLNEQARQQEQLRQRLNAWKDEMLFRAPDGAAPPGVSKLSTFGGKLKNEMGLDVVQGALGRDQAVKKETPFMISTHRPSQKQLDREVIEAAELKRREERQQKFFANASAANAAMKSHRMQKETFERKARERDIENDELKQKQKQMIEQNDKLKETKDQIAKEKRSSVEETKALAQRVKQREQELNAMREQILAKDRELKERERELNAMREQILKGEKNYERLQSKGRQVEYIHVEKKSSACAVM